MNQRQKDSTSSNQEPNNLTLSYHSQEIRTELQKKVRDTIVGVLIALPTFTIGVPFVTESIAESFNLTPGLAFRMFAAFYFSFPLLLIAWWYLDLVLSNTRHRTPQSWSSSRFLVALTIAAAYLALIVLMPRVGAIQQLPWPTWITAVAPIAIIWLVLSLCGFALYRFRLHPYKAAFSETGSYLPFLIIVITALAAIAMFSLQWSEANHWIVCVVLAVAVAGAYRLHSSNNKAKQREKGGKSRNSEFAAVLIAVLLVGLGLAPIGPKPPGGIAKADSALMMLNYSTYHEAFEKKGHPDRREALKKVKNTIDSLANSFNGKVGDAIVASYLPVRGSASDPNSLLLVRDSLAQQSDIIDYLLQSANRNSAVTLDVIRATQWRGIIFFTIPILGLLVFRYHCRRGFENRRAATDGSGLLNQEQSAHQIAVIDAWLVIMILLTLPLLKPASEVPQGRYGAMRLPQWFMPNIPNIVQPNEALVSRIDNSVISNSLDSRADSMQGVLKAVADMRRVIDSNMRFELAKMQGSIDTKFKGIYEDDEAAFNLNSFMIRTIPNDAVSGAIRDSVIKLYAPRRAKESY